MTISDWFKGDKDRSSGLPEFSYEEAKEQMEAAKREIKKRELEEKIFGPLGVTAGISKVPSTSVWSSHYLDEFESKRIRDNISRELMSIINDLGITQEEFLEVVKEATKR